MENKEWVLHVDGDAFFASCEVARRPDLFRLPVVVGEERGIVTALTYDAKHLGIKRGDPIFKIKNEYKEVSILSSHFEAYNKYATALYNLLSEDRNILKVERYSIDECFAVIVGNKNDLEEKVQNLKNKIQNKLGITYSFGISINKTLAKVASKMNKPNGLSLLITQESINKVLSNTKVENIWGIGNATYSKLYAKGTVTALDYIKSDPRDLLKADYNKSVHETYLELCGKKVFNVNEINPIQKSLQSTRTFLSKTKDKAIILSEISRNLEVAMSELRAKNLYTDRISFYFKSAVAGTSSSCGEIMVSNYTNSSNKFINNIEQMFDKLSNGGTRVYKGSGVIAHNLIQRGDLPVSLFDDQEIAIEEDNKLNSAIDKLRNKFGFNIIEYASSQNAINKREGYKAKREIKDNYIAGLPYTYLGTIYN